MRGINIKKIKVKKAPEGATVKAICDYLQYVKNQTKLIDFWIQRKTGVYDKKTGAFRLRKGPYERNGLADISGIIKPDGRRLEIEVKRPGPKPARDMCSEDQVKQIKAILAHGGLSFAASSVQEVKQMIEEYILGRDTNGESLV